MPWPISIGKGRSPVYRARLVFGCLVTAGRLAPAIGRQSPAARTSSAPAVPLRHPSAVIIGAGYRLPFGTTVSPQLCCWSGAVGGIVPPTRQRLASPAMSARPKTARTSSGRRPAAPPIMRAASRSSDRRPTGNVAPTTAPRLMFGAGHAAAMVRRCLPPRLGTAFLFHFQP